MKLELAEVKRLIEMFRSEDEGNQIMAAEALKNFMNKEDLEENKVRLVFIYHYGRYIMMEWGKNHLPEFHTLMEPIMVPDIAEDTDVHSCETYPWIKKHGTQEDLEFWAKQFADDFADTLYEHLKLPTEVKITIQVPKK